MNVRGVKTPHSSGSVPHGDCVGRFRNKEVSMKEIWKDSLKVRKQQAFERAKKAQAMHRDGMRPTQIARALRISKSTVNKDLKKDLTLLINNPEITG